MYSYVLDSRSDGHKSMRRPPQSAASHIPAVGTSPRACARVHNGIHKKILDAEMSVRKEWHRAGAAEPTLPLEAIIELVSRRRSMGHSVHEVGPPASAPQWFATPITVVFGLFRFVFYVVISTNLRFNLMGGTGRNGRKCHKGGKGKWETHSGVLRGRRLKGEKCPIEEAGGTCTEPEICRDACILEGDLPLVVLHL